MSLAQDLLQKITKVGVSICLDIDDCDTLRIDAPKGVVTNEITSQLIENKQEILKILRNKQETNKPYIDEQGILIIPFDSPQRYHWWAGGQSVVDTLRELNAPKEVIALYGPAGVA